MEQHGARVFSSVSNLSRSDMLSLAVVASVGIFGYALGASTNGQNESTIAIDGSHADFLSAAPAAEMVSDQIIEPVRAETIPLKQGEAVVASVNGEVYYPLGCSGASRIKEENRISFVSEDAAREAGYRKAKNCK